MAMKNRVMLFAAIALGVLAVAVLLFSGGGGPQPGTEEPAAEEAEGQAGGNPGEESSDGEEESEDASDGSGGSEAQEEEDEAQPEEEPQTEEERRQDAEEKLVEDFDALTDKWMEPVDDSVSMKDIDAFAERFRAVPKSRKEECLQRALNLIPDDNVMLLAGILMDKSQDKELIELVFNDVLNRAEDVKKPILEQIFKDKEHPCWADVAWIFDVTGAPESPTE